MLNKNSNKRNKKPHNKIKKVGRAFYFINFGIVLLINLTFLTCIGFKFKSLLSIKIIPLTILKIILTILTIKSFAIILINLSLIAFVKKYESVVTDGSIRTSCATGTPGSGKTSSMMSEKYLQAKESSRRLTYEYWLYKFTPDKKLSLSELAHKKEVVEAYEYYEKQNTISCLWSNVGCQDDSGRLANKLTVDHLLQKEKLPYLAVEFWDEIGNDFPAQTTTPLMLQPLSDQCRFIRHYFDGYLGFTEQDFSKTFIDVRRNTAEIKYFTKQEWALKPKLLITIYNKLKDKCVKDLVKSQKYKIDSVKYLKLQNKIKRRNKLLRKIMKPLKALINSIGFRKYSVQYLEKSVSNDPKLKDKTTFYLPSTLYLKYDERFYRNKYKAKDKELKADKFESLTYLETDLLERDNILKNENINAKVTKIKENKEIAKIVNKQLKEENK